MVVGLTDVPDPVFAEAMVGSGLAISPDDRPQVLDAISPVAGTLVTVHPHAFVVLTASGRAVLVHLGIDTVQLKGSGFVVSAEVGQLVAVGDRVVTWTPHDVVVGGRSALVPVVALDTTASTIRTEVAIGERVDAGQPLFVWS